MVKSLTLNSYMSLFETLHPYLVNKYQFSIPLTLDFLVRLSLGLSFHLMGLGQFFCHEQKRDYLSRASSQQRARGVLKIGLNFTYLPRSHP